MLAVDRLSKSFLRDGQEFLAVDDVSFHVQAGEVYGLLGPNGAGKTTTLRCVLGCLIPRRATSSSTGSVFPRRQGK
jgi:ABC-type multidrug transport system ATPase subunit